MSVRFLPDSHPVQRVEAELRSQLMRAQANILPLAFPSAAHLIERVLADARTAVAVPTRAREMSASELANLDFKNLVAYFASVLNDAGTAPQLTTTLSVTLAERAQLVAAFDQPDQVIEFVRATIERIVTGFPKTERDLHVGRNPGDVLDPYMLAATQTLMFGGELEPTIQAAVAHKAMMMLEGLLGHLHEDVIGRMRGNVRSPEPKGETLDPEQNPFPGADVVQPPYQDGGELSFHQLKSKTGSAKGGDGRRLGEQLSRLRDLYGGSVMYHALIGNTLRGHRSRAAVERAAPGVVVLVGEASFRQLTGSSAGPEFLLRLYQSAFREVARQSGYRVDAMAAEVVAAFQQRSSEEGDSFLETILKAATAGRAEDQDSRVQQRGRRTRRRDR